MPLLIVEDFQLRYYKVKEVTAIAMAKHAKDTGSEAKMLEERMEERRARAAAARVNASADADADTQAHPNGEGEQLVRDQQRAGGRVQARSQADALFRSSRQARPAQQARSSQRSTTSSQERVQTRTARQGQAPSGLQPSQRSRATEPQRRATELQGRADDPRGRAAEKAPSPQSLAVFVRRNYRYIALVAVVVLAVTALVFALRSCVNSDALDDEGATLAEEAYVSPYDWSALDRTDGRYRYLVNGEVKSKLGIDVSTYNQVIDWDAVAADGIDFAMVRLGRRGATQGGLSLDNHYLANLEGAKAAGLEVGVYFFSQAATVDEAVEEADFVLRNLEGVQLEYPVAFDSEQYVNGVAVARTEGLSNDEMTAIARAFCERIESAGYRAMLYGNAQDLSRYNYDDVKQYAVWWAEYDMPAPSADRDIVMWQYAADAVVAGVDTTADINIDLAGALS